MSRSIPHSPLLRRLVLLVAVTGLLLALAPREGAVVDGERYSAMAEQPLGHGIGSPWALRIGIPWLVWLLPFGTDAGFYLLAFLSTVAAGLLVGATVHRLGLPESHALAAGVLTCATSLTASSFWAHYVDIHMLAFFAAVLYLALRRETLWLAPLVVIGVLVKEIALFGVPLAGLVWGFRRSSWLPLAAAGLAGAGVFAALYLLAPADEASRSDGILRTQLDYSRIWLEAVASIGPVRYTANALLSVFGLALVFWLIGISRAPAWLRRAHLWVLPTLPFFVTAQWERSFALYLPLILPAAMLGLRSTARAELAALVLASAWVSGIVSALTVGGDITPSLEKLGLMSPGLILGGALAVRRIGAELRLRRAPLGAP